MKMIATWILSRQLLNLSTKEFIRAVVLPLAAVAIASALIPVLIRFMMPAGWLRFLVVLFVSIGTVMASSLFIGCTPPERKMLISLVMDKLK